MSAKWDSFKAYETPMRGRLTFEIVRGSQVYSFNGKKKSTYVVTWLFFLISANSELTSEEVVLALC